MTEEIANWTTFLFLASCSLGAAQAALEATADHISVRKQFGKALAEFQVLPETKFFLELKRIFLKKKKKKWKEKKKKL